MSKFYTLNEKYVEGYQKKKERLFIENLMNLLKDLQFVEFYNQLSETINKKEDLYNFEDINGKTYFKLLFEEYGDVGICLRPILENESLSEDIEKYLNSENVKGLKISDQINSYGLNIYFTNDLNTIIFKNNIGVNKTLLIKNKNIIVNNNYEDFNYELWILSTIGDYLYTFKEDSRKDHKFIDIIKLMQNEIDKIVEEEYKNDVCKPKFELSIMDYNENAKIVLSVEHMGLKFSEIIFPHKNICYNNGFNIYDEIRDLYNRTM